MCYRCGTCQVIEENKALLKQKYDEAKLSAAAVNESKGRINELKTAIEQRRVQRALVAGGDSGGGTDDDPEELRLKHLIEQVGRPTAGTCWVGVCHFVGNILGFVCGLLGVCALGVMLPVCTSSNQVRPRSFWWMDVTTCVIYSVSSLLHCLALTSLAAIGSDCSSFAVLLFPPPPSPHPPTCCPLRVVGAHRRRRSTRARLSSCVSKRATSTGCTSCSTSRARG